MDKKIKEMVLIIPFVYRDTCDVQVLMEEKIRPDWQNGKLNCPGGHVEEEDYEKAKKEMNNIRFTSTAFEIAAARELLEETNLDIPWGEMVYVGRRKCDDWELRVYGCHINAEYYDETAKAMTDEKLLLVRLVVVMMGDRIVDNLRYMVPEALAKVEGWDKDTKYLDY